MRRSCQMNFSPPQNLLLATKPEKVSQRDSSRLHVGHVILQYTIQYTDMARFTEISDFMISGFQVRFQDFDRDFPWGCTRIQASCGPLGVCW